MAFTFEAVPRSSQSAGQTEEASWGVLVLGAEVTEVCLQPQISAERSALVLGLPVREVKVCFADFNCRTQPKLSFLHSSTWN